VAPRVLTRHRPPRQSARIRARGTAPKSRFLRELEDSLTEDDAEQVLAVAIDWGRYAEVFGYDTTRERFSAE
jgi:NitT/TauT family transport system ATP-binding protein